MQRKSIRATVGASDVDIPIHTFTANQFVYYDSSGTGAITTKVAVTPVGTPTAGNLAQWFNATSIQDSGIALANVVTTTATPTAGQVPVFTGVGKAVSPTVVTIVGGAVSNVTALDGVNPTTWVVGPASAVSGDLVTFNGTSGKSVQDSGILATNLVTSTVTASANQVATWVGTGKAIQNVTVTIVGGAISNVTSINGTTIGNFVTGPASAVTGRIASFNGTSGKVIQDSGIQDFEVVTCPVGPSANQVATWIGAGKTISFVTVTIVGGVISNVATINTIDPSTWVIGPASSTSNNLASFNGTAGNVVKDSGILSTNVVTTSVSAPSANQLATFTGTGKAVQNTTITASGTTLSNVTAIDGFSPGTVNPFTTPVTNSAIVLFANTLGRTIIDSVVTIDSSGNISSVGLINGVNIGVHATRHLVDGSDSLFYPNSTFAWFNGDLASYTGSGLPFAPRRFKAYVAPTQTVTSALSAVTAFSTGALGSAGDYFAEYNIMITTDGSAANFSVRVIWTGGTGVAVGTVDPGVTGTLQTSSGTAAVAVIPSGVSAFVVRIKLGLTGAAATDSISFAIAWSGATAATLIANGTMFFTRAN